MIATHRRILFFAFALLPWVASHQALGQGLPLEPARGLGAERRLEFRFSRSRGRLRVPYGLWVDLLAGRAKLARLHYGARVLGTGRLSLGETLRLRGLARSARAELFRPGRSPALLAGSTEGVRKGARRIAEAGAWTLTVWVGGVRSVLRSGAVGPAGKALVAALRDLARRLARPAPRRLRPGPGKGLSPLPVRPGKRPPARGSGKRPLRELLPPILGLPPFLFAPRPLQPLFVASLAAEGFAQSLLPGGSSAWRAATRFVGAVGAWASLGRSARRVGKGALGRVARALAKRRKAPPARTSSAGLAPAGTSATSVPACGGAPRRGMVGGLRLR